VVQGIGGAIVLVSGQVILFRAYPRSRQPLLQALFALGAVVAPATLAPALEGWLVDRESWIWIFLVVPPIALGAAALMMLAEPAPLGGTSRRPFDWWGAAALATAFASTTFLFAQGNRWDWFETPWVPWLALAAAVGLLLYFVRPRFAGQQRLLDLKVFAVDDFAFAFIVSFVAGAALLGSAFLIPSFAVQVLGFTATEAGRLLLPSGALFAGALLLAGYLVQAHGMPPIATVPFGILLTMVAMWMLSGSNAQSGANDMHHAVLLRGLGLGFLFLAITLIAFGRLSGATLASGIALFNIGRLLGGLMGVAGLQTAIDHHASTSQAVLSAAGNTGSSMLAHRLGSTVSMLAGRGMDLPTATKAATAMLGRSIGHQATVIAFDTAFLLLALLFVVAAPIIVLVKVLLARASRRREAALVGAGL
jgi:DHA2 family multidrug resistance protein